LAAFVSVDLQFSEGVDLNLFIPEVPDKVVTNKVSNKKNYVRPLLDRNKFSLLTCSQNSITNKFHTKMSKLDKMRQNSKI